MQDIAILYRNNKDSELIKEALEKWELEYELSIGGNVFDDLLIQQLLTFLHVIRDLSLGKDTELLFEVMQYKWLDLNTVSVYKLARIAGKTYKSIGEVLELSYVDLKENYGLKEAEFNDLVEFKYKIISCYNLSKNMLFHEWFSLLLSLDNSDLTKQGEAKKPNGFGFMEFVLSQPMKADHLFAINSLYSAVKQFLSDNRGFDLDDFLHTTTIMQEHNISIKTQDFSVTNNRISLSTVHSAKGKEWKYVFVIGLVDKKWGNSRNRDLLPMPDSILTNVDISKKEKNEDDRRLFYVALTRASKKVYVTWSKIRADGKERLHSMFVSELDEYVVPLDETQTEKLIGKSDDLLQKLLTSATQTQAKYSRQEKEFFIELVNDFKLSVTALNNYLKDPQEFLKNSLLRSPRAKTPILAFGTAVHFALEKFYSQFQAGKILSKQEVIKLFENALNREFLIEADFIERLQHGKEVLEFYYGNVLKNPNKPLFVEKFFGGKLNQTVLMDNKTQIKLSGRMDRVDLLDQDSKLIRVVDYKTGIPKSENTIVGQSGTHDYSQRELELPETIRGRLQRQMVFYKLLAELDKTFPYHVEQVEFDFIEPGGIHKDKHVTRSFIVTTQAVEDLKKLIIKVMQEIRDLKFLER